MPAAYETLTEALTALRRQGFTLDFNLKTACLHCPQLALDLCPDDFDLVDGYGASADALTPALAHKLAWQPGHAGS